MSYDLSFCVRRGAEPPTPEALAAHFGEHVLYEIGDGAASYENEATGSTFSFSWSSSVEDDHDEELASLDLVPAGLDFTINYARPHSFALEARLELDRLVERFALAVADPQIDGMGIGEWDAAGFLRGWLSGNQAALSVLLGNLYDSGQSVKSLALLPEMEIRRHWQWNYMRRGMQAELGVIVPRVFFLRGDDGRILSLASWPDAQPIALPGVDLALLQDSDSDKSVLLPIDELGPALEQGTWGDAPMRHLRIDRESALALVADRLASEPPLEAALEGVHPGDILDLEAVMNALEALRDE